VYTSTLRQKDTHAYKQNFTNSECQLPLVINIFAVVSLTLMDLQYRNCLILLCKHLFFLVTPRFQKKYLRPCAEHSPRLLQHQLMTFSCQRNPVILMVVSVVIIPPCPYTKSSIQDKRF